MTTEQLQSALHLEALCLADGTRAVTGWYAGDIPGRAMARVSAGDAWITVAANENTIAVAVLVNAACVILAEDVAVSPEVLAKAQAHGVNLFRSGQTAYALCHAQLSL